MKVIGQRLLKKTLFYDGDEPIFHLYFGDYAGTPRHVDDDVPDAAHRPGGATGQRSDQDHRLLRPSDSLGFWEEHLTKAGISVHSGLERFGRRHLAFAHPDCGIGFELMEEPDDAGSPTTRPTCRRNTRCAGSTTDALGRGARGHGLVPARGVEHGSASPSDGDYTRYQVSGGGPARWLDLLHEPDVRQGTWTVAEGTVHHAAFEVPDFDEQARIKFEVEGMGFTDFSDRKDRGYFESIYVRTPGGVLFEACVTKGFTVDEPLERLGERFIGSPQIAGREEEVLAEMNDPIVL